MVTEALPEVPYVPPPGIGGPDALSYVITTSLALPVEPTNEMYGLLAGMDTSSRYVPGLMVIVYRLELPDGTAFTAACTLVKLPLPSLATTEACPEGGAVVGGPVGVRVGGGVGVEVV